MMLNRLLSHDLPRSRWLAAALLLILVGLLIRAGVQDREMVESLGYRIRQLFVGVFVTGYKPCGRHNRMATISPMLENSATFGARKPV